MDSRFTCAIRVAPGQDHRDKPGGEAIPMGLIFDLDGPDARISWPINTGWVLRPVLTTALRAGAQLRAKQPGVDYLLATGFPQPMQVFALNHSATTVEDGVRIETDHWELMDALLTNGSQAVFEILADLYERHLGQRPAT